MHDGSNVRRRNRVATREPEVIDIDSIPIIGYAVDQNDGRRIPVHSRYSRQQATIKMLFPYDDLSKVLAAGFRPEYRNIDVETEAEHDQQAPLAIEQCSVSGPKERTLSL